MYVQTEVAPICFGSSQNRISHDGLCLELAIPVLAGDSSFRLPIETVGCFTHGDWRVWESESAICAFCVAPVDRLLATTTSRVYREAFEIAGDRNLYRFWNFIPGINRSIDGLESYRSFGMGRHEAFFDHFGYHASTRMPAATGVGSDGDSLVVCMLAGTDEPRHYENPNQVPAYQYPDDYGPRPPSFSRGTSVTVSGRNLSFVAGTASVLGHASIGSGDLDHQIEVTLANLETLGASMNFAEALSRGTGIQRSFRIYLRNPSDLGRAQDLLGKGLLTSGDTISWLRSDLCRSDLDIEIEANLVWNE